VERHRAEAASGLPGDELLEDADGVSTRAIEIPAPASVVWPWLGQISPSPRRGLDRLVAVRGANVSVAQAAHLDLHAHLSRTESGDRDLLNGQPAAELTDDRGTMAGGCSL
jgi:hypothetical protein